MSRRFPDGFRREAAYRIGGAVGDDGRGPSIRDAFSHTPRRVAGEEAWPMAALGLQDHRSPIPWPRVQPAG